MSQLFTSSGQGTGASTSASVLPKQFPLGLTGWISLQSKGPSKVFSSTTVQKHQFFGAQPFLLSSSHICTGLLEKEETYDPSIPPFGIYTEETRIERDMCTPVFITALFTIARTLKQPRCPSADEWIRKLWYIYTMEYYSAIKKNTLKKIKKEYI